MNTSSVNPVYLLRAIGMHPRYKGYAYVLYTLTLLVEHPDHSYNLRANVYPKLMERFECSMAGIDRNIRFAVHRTCERGNHEMLKRIFNIQEKTWPPTSSEFIAVLLQWLLCDMTNGPIQNNGAL